MLPMQLVDVANWWGARKTAIEDGLGLESDVLHVHGGVLLFLLIALVTRKRLDQWTPWIALLILECANEFIDLNQRVGSIESNWPASWHDIWNTMLLPTAIMIFARVRRRWG